MNKKTILLQFYFLLFFSGYSQTTSSYRIRTVAFYNVENLFDTVNDSLTFDDDRTPAGKDRWTVERYNQKIMHLAKVLSEIGKETTKTSPDIIGLCEVENQQVVEDLVNHPYLNTKNYGIIHFDSPDERGIDVALLYKKSVFVPTSFKSYRLLLSNLENERDYTRDQLVVGGLLDDEELYLIVNHWPSRSGGEARSKPYRIMAAGLNTRIIDSLRQMHQVPKIISMGDMNDNPLDDSLKKILRIKGEKDSLIHSSLFNPMEGLYRKGFGSLAYRDKWSLFDQIFFTSNFLSEDRSTYIFWKVGIFNPSYLITQKGRYKGYPFRTYGGGNYNGGYSDHFPVYIFLIKEAN